MREILFRGKTDKGEWVEGYVFEMHILGDKTTYISTKPFMLCNDGDFDYEPFAVDTETVGQYTGLVDKNGTKIFEGDIVKGMSGLYRVYFDTSLACFEWVKINGNWEESFSGFADEYEIIGNIHDNPELLGGD